MVSVLSNTNGRIDIMMPRTYTEIRPQSFLTTFFTYKSTDSFRYNCFSLDLGGLFQADNFSAVVGRFFNFTFFTFCV
ncbi:hypothetical protein FXB70_04345 [Aggregatibacter actinomycetemcomitans]|nr:hypothetical protein SC1000_04610 [Aggregatibacter actinomycetemcomitans]TYA16509.1 hypothetical protein FXE10_03370 [Aggregatibacter actinomycetemcomitans]TYA23791.1 hypothetical protein FXB91_02485 [Aggregatibacter actinomycetemcomitans]TYA25141.1 hypothetical protein FXE05_05820 [Aggregatibacter actinomycetemcomitans]TYA27649.1 hypothetical protein FXB92_02585 [Aggregatibacter actinomycetemcomitans]